MQFSQHGFTRSPSGNSRAFRGGGRQRRTAGLTIIEMLVSMAITLIMLFAIVRVFELMGDGVNSGRATMELSAQLRQATHLLQEDLDGLTVPTQPWAYEETAAGYFQVIEGPDRDLRGAIDPVLTKIKEPVTTANFGNYDIDDILMFTSRAKGRTFKTSIDGYQTSTGGATGGTGPRKKILLESQVAEVVWFCHPIARETSPGNFQRISTGLNPDGSLVTTNLYRLVIPVRPGERNTVIELNDPIDKRPLNGRLPDNTQQRVYGVSLEQLTRRHNRFLHDKIAPLKEIHELNIPVLHQFMDFPPVDFGGLDAGTGSRLEREQASFRAEHLVLRNVLSFDVRVFHPGATERHVGQNISMGPGDVEWDMETDTQLNSNFQNLRTGAYIDLACNETGILDVPNFHLNPHPRSQLTIPTWDTWPFYYEQDGKDQDDNPATEMDRDEGINGIDDPVMHNDADTRDGVVDDPAERETSPPYPYPLRGIQVRVRVVDPESQQIRQVTMCSDFVPG
jgi:hypothetical protein